LNPNAPYLKNADLLVAADCVPFAYPDFHRKLLKGKILIILCPKLDTTINDYIEKMTLILKNQNIQSITVVHMEVPCCFGVGKIIQTAKEKSGSHVTVKDITISIDGRILE